jgi:hypothetical protein
MRFESGESDFRWGLAAVLFGPVVEKVPMRKA